MKEIRIENLNFSYDGKKILDNLNLTFNQGELVGILGANGSGKSTFLKILIGFLKKDSGKIYIDGVEQDKIILEEYSKKISLIAQKFDYNMDFNVLDMLKLGRVPHLKNRIKGLDNDDYEIIEKIIKELKLERYLDRNIRTLSGGEVQRVLLGRAFIQNGEAIFLDEPTSALDIKYSIELLEKVVERVKDKKLIAGIVLHDINLASIFCDKIVLLKEGKIFTVGTPKEVLSVENLREVYGFEVDIVERNDMRYIIPMRLKDKGEI